MTVKFYDVFLVGSEMSGIEEMQKMRRKRSRVEYCSLFRPLQHRSMCAEAEKTLARSLPAGQASDPATGAR